MTAVAEGIRKSHLRREADRVRVRRTVVVLTVAFDLGHATRLIPAGIVIDGGPVLGTVRCDAARRRVGEHGDGPTRFRSRATTNHTNPVVVQKRQGRICIVPVDATGKHTFRSGEVGGPILGGHVRGLSHSGGLPEHDPGVALGAAFDPGPSWGARRHRRRGVAQVAVGIEQPVVLVSGDHLDGIDLSVGHVQPHAEHPLVRRAGADHLGEGGTAGDVEQVAVQIDCQSDLPERLARHQRGRRVVDAQLAKPGAARVTVGKHR